MLLFLLFLGCFFLGCHELNASLEDLSHLETRVALSKPNELYRFGLTHKILRYACCIVNKKMHVRYRRCAGWMRHWTRVQFYLSAGSPDPENAVFLSKQKLTNSGV